MMVGRNDEHFPEIGRQLVGLAEVIDDLADLPMLGHRDQVALHQAAGGFLAVGERFLDRGAVVGLHRPEHGELIVLFEVFDQCDRVVGVELGGEVGDLLRLHLVDHILADVLVQFGIDVGVDDAGQRLDQVGALVARGELDQVGDVGRVKLGRPVRARSRHRRRQPHRAPRGRIADEAGLPRREPDLLAGYRDRAAGRR